MAEEIRGEMVANVMEVVVRLGQQVAEGDTIVMLESMKMEIPVLCETAGEITRIEVESGQVIQAGDLIAVID